MGLFIEKNKKAEGLAKEMGNLASARYFANNILPNVAMQAELIKNADASALDCPEEAFLMG